MKRQSPHLIQARLLRELSGALFCAQDDFGSGRIEHGAEVLHGAVKGFLEEVGVMPS